MSPDDAHAFLNDLPRFSGESGAGYEPGLGRIRALLEALGNPHERFRSVHVAGTNGKGSTASFLAAIGTAAGLRTGLHTSPELIDLTERMRLDGVPASGEWLANAVAHARERIEAVGATFFEATVALSFLYFAEERVDLAVVEVGLGGRLDATNVLHPAASLLTRIGRDHTALLGDTLTAIAREKAGIVKTGAPVLMGENDEAPRETVRTVARRRDAPWHYVPSEVTIERESRNTTHTLATVRSPRRRYERLCIALPGRHQRENAGLALRAAEEVFEADAEAVRRGLQDVRHLAGLRGRGEMLQRDPLVMVDVAHNADGLRGALRGARAETDRRAGRLFVLLGLLRDKELPPIAQTLADVDALTQTTSLETERALSASTLAQRLAEEGASVFGESASVAKAAETLRHHMQSADVLLVTGSHHVVAQMLTAGTFAPAVRTIA